MQADRPNHLQLPASFRPGLSGHVVGLMAFTSASGLVGWLALRDSSWIAGAASTATAAVVVALVVDLVLWKLRGPVLHVVDPLGLCKGRAGHLRQLFSWCELQAWSYQEPSEGINRWSFKTGRKEFHVGEDEVSVPSCAEFEAAVRIASGLPCAYPDLAKSIKEAAGERFKA